MKDNIEFQREKAQILNDELALLNDQLFGIAPTDKTAKELEAEKAPLLLELEATMKEIGRLTWPDEPKPKVKPKRKSLFKNVRFQKRKKLCKGIWLNFSKSGVSVSIGFRWISLNVGRNGVYLSSSLAGTGLSIRKKLTGRKR